MAIELPANNSASLRNLQSNLANNLGQQRQVLQSVLRALNIREGESFAALVKAVNRVDEPLRARILNLTQPVTETDAQSASRTAGVSTPAVSRDASDLTALLKSAGLRLVELDARGRTLLTLTDRPLQAGAKIEVLVRAGQLVLAGNTGGPDNLSVNPAINRAGTGGAVTQSVNPAGTPFTPSLGQSGLPGNLQNTLAGARQSPPPLPAAQASHTPVGPRTPVDPRTVIDQRTGIDSRPSAGSAAATTNTLQAQHTEALQSALRTLLPQQQSLSRPVLSETLEIASNLSRLLAQPANRGLRSQIPASVQASLRSVAAFIRSSQQLSEPRQLQRALAGSGLQMEHRLASQAGATQRSADPKNMDLKSTAQAVRTLVNQALPRADLKAGLEQLTTLLNQALPAQTTVANPLAQPLYLMLRQLLKLPPGQQSLATKLDREQVLRGVQQQVNLALDKILLQQLNSLQRSFTGNETTPSQHWQLEIPVRYGHELSFLQLRIDEDWVNEYREDEKPRQSSRVQQWLVKLSFELPQAGTLHAHLCVVENSVSASLWAENAETLELARQRLLQLKQRLESDGVEVKKLECFAGRPVQDNIQLNYSLVDIKT